MPSTLLAKAAATHLLQLLGVSFLLLLSACELEASTESAAQPDSAAKKEGTIFNYIEYSDSFASAGQPTVEQLKEVSEEGVDQVVYLAFSDQEKSLPAEDRVVKNLGMNYLQIPVDWKAPQPREFYLFAQAMQLDPTRKTLLHCQANFRASAFALLYRVLHLQVPLADAKADMNAIWIPNSVWTNFIKTVLEENNVDPQCAGCDWTPSTIGD